MMTMPLASLTLFPTFGRRVLEKGQGQASSRVLAGCRSCLCGGRKAWGSLASYYQACANVLVIKQDGMLPGRQANRVEAKKAEAREKARAHTHTKFKDLHGTKLSF